MKKYIAILFLCIASIYVNAEVTMHQLTEAEIKSTEYTIGKMVIQDGVLSFVALDGTILASEKVNNITSIVFVKSSAGIETVAQSTIKIYPNPASDYIIVEGLDDKVIYRIFDLSGKCVSSGNGTMIPVYGLSKGSYILQVNTQLVKFIKD